MGWGERKSCGTCDAFEPGRGSGVGQCCAEPISVEKGSSQWCRRWAPREVREADSAVDLDEEHPRHFSLGDRVVVASGYRGKQPHGVVIGHKGPLVSVRLDGEVLDAGAADLSRENEPVVLFGADVSSAADKTAAPGLPPEDPGDRRVPRRDED